MRGREGRRGKRPNSTPSRTKYWMMRRLEKHKVKNMMQSCGMTEVQARREWRDKRKGRTNFVSLRVQE